jgi:hypothetical protein
MRIPVSVQSGAGDLATIVNVSRPLQMKRCPRRNQSIQVENRAVLPKKGSSVAVKCAANERSADDLSFRIYSRGKAARILIYRSKISNLAHMLPESRVIRKFSGERSNPNDLSSLIECFSCCLAAADRATQICD